MKQIIKDYFYDFHRGFKLERLGVLGYIAIGTLYNNWTDADKLTLSVGLPIVFAMVSGAFHMVSLPFMMYLVPYTKEQREEYMQKMLYVKILVPIAFAVICDVIALLRNELSFYAFVLQIVTILIITYICGTLNDGTVSGTEKKIAYGSFKDWVGVPLMLCYITGPVMFMICMDSISTTEFWIILGVLLLVHGPLIRFIQKRWQNIRGNFADYEIASKMEVR